MDIVGSRVCNLSMARRRLGVRADVKSYGNIIKLCKENKKQTSDEVTVFTDDQGRLSLCCFPAVFIFHFCLARQLC